MTIVLQNKRNIERVTYFGYALFAVVGFCYLLILNDFSTSGFDLQAARAEATKIGKELETIDAEISTPASIYALEHSVKVQEMVKVEKRSYKVLSNDSGVAYAPVY